MLVLTLDYHNHITLTVAGETIQIQLQRAKGTQAKIGIVAAKPAVAIMRCNCRIDRKKAASANTSDTMTNGG